MKWNRLTDAAKKVVDSRGGTDGLKRDADKLREIATGHGTPKEKAQRAADHLKQSKPEPNPEAKPEPNPEAKPEPKPNGERTE